MIWTAAVMGFVGSLHCAAMCGPIAIASTSRQPLISKLVYNLGRIITYAAMGAAFGLFGLGFEFAGVQQWLSIIIGAVLVFVALFFGIKPLETVASGFLRKPYTWLKAILGKMIGSTTLTSRFAVGLANGLLPCGLVYMGIAGSIAMGNMAESALYMVLFGVGTLPMMLGVSYAGNIVGQKFRRIAVKAVPVMVVAIGLLFILRGLNLGIPYVSPHLIETASIPIMENCIN